MIKKSPALQLSAEALVLFILSLIIYISSTALGNEAIKPFRFHLTVEPSTLSPVDTDNTDSDYLFSNIYRGLFTYDNEKGILPEGATKCERSTPLRLICTLNSKVKWNDGVPVKADDYVRAFQALFRPGRPARSVMMLSTLENAQDILAQKKSPIKLGVRAKSDFVLEFTFQISDFEFEDKLTSAILVPWREEPSSTNWKTNHYNGPYEVAGWIPGKKISLTPNKFYVGGEKLRPEVEVLIVPEDTAALNLYETGGLDFLRRLPSALIPEYRTHADFFLTPLDRFDYLGFGPELNDQFELRKALSLGADYQGFAKAFHALGRPGCMGISLSLLDHDHCLDFDLINAKAAFDKVSKDTQKKSWYFYFSQAGGDDLVRVGEWYQAQWKKNLGLDIKLETREPKVYLNLLTDRPPAIFRKGFSLDRPSCQAAVEAFVKNSPNNFIRQDSKRYDSLFIKLESSQTRADQKRICGQMVDELISNFRLIPQGRIHFPMLQNQHYVGLKVNSLNQLNLSNLKFMSH